MGVDEKMLILARKRRAELKCLNIDPDTFLMITNYLNTKYKFIVKGEKTFVFSMDDEPTTTHDIVKDVVEVFALPKSEVRKMRDEWVRDRYIYHNMTENVSLHWEFLNVPLMYGENFEDYNF